MGLVSNPIEAMRQSQKRLSRSALGDVRQQAGGNGEARQARITFRERDQLTTQPVDPYRIRRPPGGNRIAAVPVLGQGLDDDIAPRLQHQIQAAQPGQAVVMVAGRDFSTEDSSLPIRKISLTL